jgi:DNA-directed RNA polymerase specialized sigma24 family protein
LKNALKQGEVGMDNHADAARTESPVVQRPRRFGRRRASYVLSEEDEFLLAQLPAYYSDILRQDGSIADIAHRLGLAEGTVKSRTHRARAALDYLRKTAGNAPQ